MGETAIIHLSSGEPVKVDAQDVEMLSRFRWHPDGNNKSKRKYAAAFRNGKNIKMHRMIIDCPEGFLVDHINFDSLDNRRSNLRIVTRKESQRHRRGWGSGEFKGVDRTPKGRYVARIKPSGKKIYLGTFDTAIEAAHRYDRAALEFYGEFAVLNFPVP